MATKPASFLGLLAGLLLFGAAAPSFAAEEQPAKPAPSAVPEGSRPRLFELRWWHGDPLKWLSATRGRGTNRAQWGDHKGIGWSVDNDAPVRAKGEAKYDPWGNVVEWATIKHDVGRGYAYLNERKATITSTGTVVSVHTSRMLELKDHQFDQHVYEDANTTFRGPFRLTRAVRHANRFLAQPRLIDDAVAAQRARWAHEAARRAGR